ncbi:MAG: UDP-N-acetylmuramoyl-L-alanine--D-glutamate ligase [Melioribacteraceae bacterium]|nr:UDP-N-acetylmuramoyl-L-alanine--D-glutamate ligase [Melioribacteraceae bacterium]
MNIQGKKISILGAVRSGIGAAKLAKQLGAIPFVSDMSSMEKLSDQIKQLEELNIEYEIEAHSEKVFDADFIITSPGVPGNAPVLLKAKEKCIDVISEIEFASWFCKGTIIAITGTNGKTTTTSLCAHVLNEAGYKTYLAGNIGFAFSEIVLDVEESDYVALEVSSFQLDHISKFRPKYAMILNITPDHLDRYDFDFNKYVNSKLSISMNQIESDCLITNVDDRTLGLRSINTQSELIQFGIENKIVLGAYLLEDKLYFKNIEQSEFICDSQSMQIKGEHNIQNALAVICVTKKIGLTNVEIGNGLKSFSGVEHRLEFVKEINGISFINDSKATNVDSVWFAIRSFDRPLYLILGGKDKGNNYDQILEPVKKHVKKIYAIGSSAEKVYEYFHSRVETEITDTIEKSIDKSIKEAENGDIVLLSPACASFDQFNSYEHRGEVFKKIVNSL